MTVFIGFVLFIAATQLAGFLMLSRGGERWMWVIRVLVLTALVVGLALTAGTTIAGVVGVVLYLVMFFGLTPVLRAMILAEEREDFSAAARWARVMAVLLPERRDMPGNPAVLEALEMLKRGNEAAGRAAIEKAASRPGPVGWPGRINLARLFGTPEEVLQFLHKPPRGIDPVNLVDRAVYGFGMLGRRQELMATYERYRGRIPSLSAVRRQRVRLRAAAELGAVRVVEQMLGALPPEDGRASDLYLGLALLREGQARGNAFTIAEGRSRLMTLAETPSVHFGYAARQILRFAERGEVPMAVPAGITMLNEEEVLQHLLGDFEGDVGAAMGNRARAGWMSLGLAFTVFALGVVATLAPALMWELRFAPVHVRELGSLWRVLTAPLAVAGVSDVLAIAFAVGYAGRWLELMGGTRRLLLCYALAIWGGSVGAAAGMMLMPFPPVAYGGVFPLLLVIAVGVLVVGVRRRSVGLRRSERGMTTFAVLGVLVYLLVSLMHPTVFAMAAVAAVAAGTWLGVTIEVRPKVGFVVNTATPAGEKQNGATR